MSPCENIMILLVASLNTEKSWYKPREEWGVKSRIKVRITQLASCRIWGQLNAENQKAHEGWQVFRYISGKQALVLLEVNIENTSAYPGHVLFAILWFQPHLEWVVLRDINWLYNDSPLIQVLAESLLHLCGLFLHCGASLAHVHAQKEASALKVPFK